jgi:DNA-directed RNA polymerase specialized sigma24 family protein
MAAPKKMSPEEEIVRLMVLQLRRTARSQAEVIIELDKAGFGQSRIAELVGSTPNSVNVALNKAKKRVAKGRASGDES